MAETVEILLRHERAGQARTVEFRGPFPEGSWEARVVDEAGDRSVRLAAVELEGLLKVLRGFQCRVPWTGSVDAGERFSVQVGGPGHGITLCWSREPPPGWKRLNGAVRAFLKGLERRGALSPLRAGPA